MKAACRRSVNTVLFSRYAKGTKSDILLLQDQPRHGAMITSSFFSLRTLASAAALCAALTGVCAAPAQARVFVGVGLGVPFYGPGFYPGYYPGYYPPPPVYYAPPPVYYAPPQTYTPAPAAAPSGRGQACYAESYVCPMDRPVAQGASCYCPGNGGQRIWGRAN
jgi:hypothetical protein